MLRDAVLVPCAVWSSPCSSHQAVGPLAVGLGPVSMLHSTCQQIWKTQQWPQESKRSVFIPIPKKGNDIECSSNSTIALISQASEVMLNSRMPPQLEKNHVVPTAWQDEALARDVTQGDSEGQGRLV